ncbi:MAG: phosphatase PAP2 family protein [Gemmatimonadales bacterium]
MVGLSASPAQAARRGITSVDRLFLGYILFNSVALLARARSVESWPPLLLANLLAALLVVLLARAPRSRFVDFLTAYPLLLAAAYYTQIGIVTIDRGVLHDPLIQRLEQAVFGGQVSLTWHALMPWPALSWVLHACYGGYYLVLLTAPLFLYLRRPHAAFERGVFIMTLGLYGCYAIFVLFPVAGPRYFWGNATGVAASVLPARLLRDLLEGGSAMGTAFPSSHVAATWCAVYSVWRDARPLALLLAPIAIGLALGTVYGQFHYAVDALAGALTAVLACALEGPLRRAFASRPLP